MALKLGVNSAYEDELVFASSRTNVDAAALAALIDAEAAKEGGVWQEDSFNPTSKAAGLTQFLESTWIDQATRSGTHINEVAVAQGLVAGKKVVAGKTAQLLKLRFDAKLSITAAAEYGVSNLKFLEGKGLIPAGVTDDDRAKYMYLAHHEGAGGAQHFLDGTKVYTTKNLEGQVGAAQAAKLIAKAGGNANAAYRKWMSGYIDEKIVPSKFRDSTPAVPIGTPPVVTPPTPVPVPVPPVTSGLTTGDAIVSTEGLNLRDAPNGTILKALTIGDTVTLTGPVQVDIWQPVTVASGTEAGKKGFVSNRYLRLPTAPSKEALVQKAIAEWIRFKKGSGRESVPPFDSFVGEMWKSIGSSLTGKDTGVPWSAAFISFCVIETAKTFKQYKTFKSAASHSVFSNDSIGAKLSANKAKPFWGYRITEERPGLGDIIHRNRGTGSFSYDFAENHSSFESHSDIVVEVRQNVVRVIGGNVGDTVSLSRMSGADDLQEYNLDANGFLASGQKIIALLKNRSDEM